jgi:hypothetical protein
MVIAHSQFPVGILPKQMDMPIFKQNSAMALSQGGNDNPRGEWPNRRWHKHILNLLLLRMILGIFEVLEKANPLIQLQGREE